MQYLTITFWTGETKEYTFTRVHFIRVDDKQITIRGEFEDDFGGAIVTRWFTKSDVLDWRME